MPDAAAGAPRHPASARAWALGSMRWPAIGQPVVVIPLGSCEQHGPHLPLDTDSQIAEALARRLVEARMGLVLAPTVPFGASWEHAGFPGLLSLNHDLVAALLVELGHSADWARGLVFVNGHGGNALGLRSAVRTLTHEGRSVMAWSPALPHGDLHAGRTETSMMLALAPDEVALEAMASGFLGTPPPSVFTDGIASVSPSGVLGDPLGASTGDGHVLLQQSAGDLIRAYDTWQVGR